LYADSASWPSLPICLVEGRTSAGFIAVGEAGRGESEQAVEATLRSLLGVDLLRQTAATVWMTHAPPGGMPQSYPYWSWEAGSHRSYALLESLWLDTIGRHTAMPAHTLLGGAVRKQVAVDFWANRPDAGQLAQLVEEAVSLGCRGMKLKCDAGGDTVHAIREIAADVPADFHFTIDPMLSWRNFAHARKLMNMLAPLGVEIRIEDPFPYHLVEDWHHLRRAFADVTIICHARDEQVLRQAVREDLADALNLGGGGAIDFVRSAAIAELYGKDCWCGSGLELGVQQQLRLHAAASARCCTMPCDLQSQWVRQHTLIEPRLHIENGFACVPDRPGLGVDIDRAALKAYCAKQWQVG
jgi:muconate cycloisomerase